MGGKDWTGGTDPGLSPSVSVSRPALPARPAPPALPAPPPRPASVTHHDPDVRHGPEQRSTAPPAKPRRSVVTRTGRPSAIATRAGTGWRHRRSADVNG